MEAVQNISSFNPAKNRASPARVGAEKTVPRQNESIPKDTRETEVSPSLLDQVQENISARHNINLQFSVHEATGRTIVKVTDQESGKLIREIPPKQVLDLADRLEEMIGLFFDKKV
ncbi:MAG: flagellar protein FlaG [Thermodesulfobacteriota bacterium]|nr:flagellar protein FlaG [Thermodesulfobacteriota bacterium]